MCPHRSSSRRTGRYPVILKGELAIAPTRRTANASQALKDTAAFNHKAALTLALHGTDRETIADTLGLSIRSVRRFLNTPCPAFEAEQRDVRRCRALQQLNLTKRGKAPFLAEDYLAAQGLVGVDEAAWLGPDWRALRTSRKIAFYLSQPVEVSQYWMAQRLGITQQAVSRHVQRLKEKGAGGQTVEGVAKP